MFSSILVYSVNISKVRFVLQRLHEDVIKYMKLFSIKKLIS